jgi:hypothetical protein
VAWSPTALLSDHPTALLPQHDVPATGRAACLIDLTNHLTEVAAPPMRHQVQQVVAIAADAVFLAGCTHLLSAHADVDALDHESALTRIDWSAVDVVLVDPVDRRHPVDQLAGIAVVEHIRRCAGRQPTIVGTSDVIGDDVVRRRLWEATATAYVHRHALTTARDVRSAVLAGDRHHTEMPPAWRDDETPHRLGITARSRVNDGVRAALAERLVGDGELIGPRGRERYARRTRWNAIARLTPMSADGRMPDRHQTVPSLVQIRRLVTWATRVDRMSV